MLDQTAQGAYGFTSWSPAIPGGASILPETQSAMTGEGLGAVTSKLPLGINNPLFWLLILFLIFTGWVFGGASFGIKKIGGGSIKVGS